MKLLFQSNMNRHLGKLANIIKISTNKKLEHKIQRNQRSIKCSISWLYRQSVSLIKKENNARMIRMNIDKIRRQAEHVLHNCSHNRVHLQVNEENINVNDSDDSEIIVTQDDLDGEEQLERLENMTSFDSGLGSFEKSFLGRLKTNDELIKRHDEQNSDPIDLSYSSFCNQTKLITPHKIAKEYSISPRTNPFDTIRSNNIVSNTPIINNLPSRRSADDHLEQFMMVDPNQNIKWKQLADKFNKELGPNVCGVCHKTLSCKSALTMHYRVHTEERPFVCKVCEKRFSTKGNLKTHLGQHADVTDQYCLNSTMSSNQFKHNSLIVPQSSINSPTLINNHPRNPLHSGTFSFPLPSIPSNPHILFNMFNNSSGEFNLQEAFKTSQKLPNNDINSNFIVKSEETNVNYFCNLCHQAFPSKLNLEIHLRSHCSSKDFLGTIQNSKFQINFKDRILNNKHLKEEIQTKSDIECDQNNDFKNSADKFSLNSIMGLHNHPANIFSLMNNSSFFHRPMMLPFPGLVSHPGMPRQPLSMGTPNHNFNYNQ